uniref:UDP-N-acetylenolpyruvoylglucosamine reductase n=1 Tax=uncultured bacterium contig00176 TaxID=1181598 RepID=A0A806K1J9_9BACT|nr:UDP-N-acetylenolpyruvoylglucosamine reductase [uncultured bacterium contig00176]
MELPEELMSIPYSRDVPFRKLTTLGLGGVCRWLFEPVTEGQARRFVKTCRAFNLNYRVLGGGSNLLALSDVTVPVMRLALPKELSVTENRVYASASCSHPALARDVADVGLSGIEWACGIPGSFGGALRMNAGAHGGEWGHVLHAVRFLTADGEIVEKKTAISDFSYRSSFLADGHIALGAWFDLTKGDAGAIKKKMGEYLSIRRQRQPTGRTAGSVFKNPPGKIAGQLIESAGLKGVRIGNAEVSSIHSNFLVNLGDASPSDYWELVKYVRAKVAEAHDCQLELEIEVWSEPKAIF